MSKTNKNETDVGGSRSETTLKSDSSPSVLHKKQRKNLTFRLVWIPGHSGIAGYIKADEHPNSDFILMEVSQFSFVLLRSSV